MKIIHGPFRISALFFRDTHLLATAALILLFLIGASTVKGQDFQNVKYGDDFLSIGGGARALAMGSAYTAMANDVTAAYWNVAGLTQVKNIETIYMHAERFSGVVGYDYGGIAIPVNPENNSVVGVTLMRQGVDGIKNTLDAWDEERDLPKADPANHITEFSYADMAFLLSFASSTTEYFSWGVSAKILNSRIGPFADAWGYSLDFGMLYRGDFANVGIQFVNIPSLMKFWNVNAGNLQQLADVYDDEVPSGQNEKTPMSLKVGLSKQIPINDFDLGFATDVDFHFNGRKAYYINMGDISMEPHLGTELTYKDLVSIRAGITDVVKDFSDGYTMTPTLGAGINFKSVTVDYGITSFSGVSSTLGTTHRISLIVGF